MTGLLMLCCMQSLVQRFTSAFEETKQELHAVTDDLDRNVNAVLAGKLNSADLPEALQDANLVNRATMAAQLKQVCLMLSPHMTANMMMPSSWATVSIAEQCHLQILRCMNCCADASACDMISKKCHTAVPYGAITRCYTQAFKGPVQDCTRHSMQAVCIQLGSCPLSSQSHPHLVPHTDNSFAHCAQHHHVVAVQPVQHRK